MLINPEMYEETACYDPSHLESFIDHEHNNTLQQTIHHNNNFTSIESSTDYHLMNMELEHQNQIIHDLNWSNNHAHNQIQMENNNNNNNCLPTPPDLLNLFQLPRCFKV